MAGCKGLAVVKAAALCPIAHVTRMELGSCVGASAFGVSHVKSHEIDSDIFVAVAAVIACAGPFFSSSIKEEEERKKKEEMLRGESAALGKPKEAPERAEKSRDEGRRECI